MKLAARRPIEAVEVSLRGLRWTGAVFLVGGALASRDNRLFDSYSRSVGLAIGLAFMLFMANLASRRLDRPSAPISRLVIFQLAIDVMVTATVIILSGAKGDSLIWITAGLPVLEGALRYRLVGAVSTWLVLALILAADSIRRWSPGDGYAPLIELLNHLALGIGLGVPAGYIADNLAGELAIVAQERQEALRRSRLLAVLTVSSQDFTTRDPNHLAATAVEALIELGYTDADIGFVDSGGRPWRTLASESQRDGSLEDPQEGSQDGAQEGSLVAPLGGHDADGRIGEIEHLALDQEVGTSVASDDLTTCVGVVAVQGTRTMLLRGRVDTAESAWQLQYEAFQVLATNLATAMSVASQYREIEATQRQLEYQATHDPLTGLLNRAGLMDVLRHGLESETTGAGHIVAFVDLDGFKAVNDTYGHETGDTVLIHVARQLEAAMPDDAVIARLGGDEFVIAVGRPIGASFDDMERQVEAAVTIPVSTPHGDISVGASTGFDVVTGPSATPETTLRRADARMYQAKERNRRSRQVEAGGEQLQITAPPEDAPVS